MLWTLNRPNRRLAKIGLLATIAVAFLRVVYGPAGGWGAVEFWLLIFYAAAMNGVAQHEAAGSDGDEVDPRARDDFARDIY